MRLGKLELAIMKYLSYDGPEDGYGDIRKGIGRDPDENFNGFKNYVYAIKDMELIRIREKAIKKLLHKYQVTFSQALNRLLEKKLIHRVWGITVRTDAENLDWVGEGYSPEDKEAVLLYFYKMGDEDTSNCKVTSTKPYYSLTKLGRIELAKRWSDYKLEAWEV